MNENQIDDEVCKILGCLENMEHYGIITSSERSTLRSKTKAWAYDQIIALGEVKEREGTE